MQEDNEILNNNDNDGDNSHSREVDQGFIVDSRGHSNLQFWINNFGVSERCAETAIEVLCKT